MPLLTRFSTTFKPNCSVQFYTYVYIGASTKIKEVLRKRLLVRVLYFPLRIQFRNVDNRSHRQWSGNFDKKTIKINCPSHSSPLEYDHRYKLPLYQNKILFYYVH